jgi:hypothetical protein
MHHFHGIPIMQKQREFILVYNSHYTHICVIIYLICNVVDTLNCRNQCNLYGIMFSGKLMHWLVNENNVGKLRRLIFH